MRLEVPLRRRPVLWLILPAMMLLIIVNNASTTAPPLPGYWTWIVSRSVLLLIVPAAVSSVGAALEASRIRSRRLDNVMNMRRPVSVVIGAVWPSYVAGFVLQIAAVMLVSMHAWGGDSRIPVSILGALAAMLLFHTSIGFLAGSLVKPVLGVPIALAASYAWLGFTGTVGWFPVRHLAGLVLETCCFYDQQLIAASAGAAATFSAACAVAFFWWATYSLRLSATHRRIRGLWLPTLILVMATVASLAMANGLKDTAAMPRTAEELSCSRGEVEVCLYPEQKSADGGVSLLVGKMVRRVRSSGVAIPRKVIAAQSPSSGETISFRYIPGMTQQQIAGSLASSFRGDLSLTCAAEPVSRTIARQNDGDVVRGWLAMQMEGTAGGDGDVSGRLAAVLRMPG